MSFQSSVQKTVEYFGVCVGGCLCRPCDSADLLTRCNAPFPEAFTLKCPPASVPVLPIKGIIGKEGKRTKPNLGQRGFSESGTDFMESGFGRSPQVAGGRLTLPPALGQRAWCRAGWRARRGAGGYSRGGPKIRKTGFNDVIRKRPAPRIGCSLSRDNE